jgi:hypothetical protein
MLVTVHLYFVGVHHFEFKYPYWLMCGHDTLTTFGGRTNWHSWRVWVACRSDCSQAARSKAKGKNGVEWQALHPLIFAVLAVNPNAKGVQNEKSKLERQLRLNRPGVFFFCAVVRSACSKASQNGLSSDARATNSARAGHTGH